MLIDGEEKWRIRRKPKRIKKGKTWKRHPRGIDIDSESIWQMTHLLCGSFWYQNTDSTSSGWLKLTLDEKLTTRLSDCMQKKKRFYWDSSFRVAAPLFLACFVAINHKFQRSSKGFEHQKLGPPSEFLSSHCQVRGWDTLVNLQVRGRRVDRAIWWELHTMWQNIDSMKDYRLVNSWCEGCEPRGQKRSHRGWS